MTRFTCIAGYLPDHEYEPDETGLTWHEARSGVLDALGNEVDHAKHEAAFADDEREEEEWTHWLTTYRAAVDVLLAVDPETEFDITLRCERYAITREG